MTYDRLRKLIISGNYDRQDMLNKMDVFLMANRITTEEYYKLKDLMSADSPEVTK